MSRYLRHAGRAGGKTITARVPCEDCGAWTEVVLLRQCVDLDGVQCRACAERYDAEAARETEQSMLEVL